MPKIAIFDLDGTLALIDHRLHYKRGPGPKDDKAFHDACHKDEPNWSVIRSAWALNLLGHDIWVLSGRSDAVLSKTVAWLDRFQVPFTKLIMRPDHDKSEDHQLKQQWALEWGLNHENVLCVFEDRTSVVDMWRRMGIPCFQVAPGDF